MNTNRRNFIKNSALAFSGIIAAQSIFSKNSYASKTRQAAYNGKLNDGEVISNARENIKKIRMTEVELKILNASGQPLKNMPVEVVQLKHAFPFGDCNPGMDSLFRKYNGNSEKLEQYRKVFAEVLNTVNSTCYWTERPRNNMAKTEEYQGEPKYDGFADTVDWANANGLYVKGHPLFWPVEKAIPDWIKRYPYETQLKFLEVRLRSLVARFKGKVQMWDAVNEMLWEPALKNLSQRNWPHLETTENMAEYISFVLRICREEDPDALYLLNDYGLELPREKELKAKDGTVVTALMQRKRYIELIKKLKATGDQPNAVGLQCHDGWQLPADQMAFYDEMAQTGLPLHITEFWAHTDHLQTKGQRLTPGNGDFTTENFQNTSAPKYSQEEIDLMQADFVENYLTCAFGHNAVEAFIFWGFMDMATVWKPEDSPSFELKPVYHRVKKLIKSDWNTRLTATTNGDGIIRFRGFYGKHSLRYSTLANGTKNTGIPFEISKTQNGLITLKTVV